MASALRLDQKLARAGSLRMSHPVFIVGKLQELSRGKVPRKAMAGSHG